jgi:ABC-type transport system involved in multi-copper enzyme maturation permease subunit
MLEEIQAPQSSVTHFSPKGSSAQRVTAIALNTFRESVRDRVLYNLILFVLLLVGASIFVGELTIADESKFTADLGLSAMLVFGALIAIFIGVGLVYKEIDRRTIYNMLSKPVHRYEFIVGKYLGLCLTLLVNSAVMLVATELAILYVNGGWVRLQQAVLAAGCLVYLELTLIVAIALMFSTFTTPLLSALFSFAVYVIGHFSADLLKMAAITESTLTRAMLTTLYYLLPNLSNFNYINEASHGRIVPARMGLAALVYGGVYISILLSASIVIFQKKSFK